MKRTNNPGVISAWRLGDSAHSTNLRTDGVRLWSYGLVIGRRVFLGAASSLEVVDYTAAGGKFVSQTTSSHVGLARRAADRVVAPE
jgi:hypothetical protein